MDIHTTPKQLEILILIYRYRFLNRTQIQTLLNHKNTKCINTWLKDLYDKRIIGRHYTRETTENTKPAIYYLMTKSKYLLIGQNGVNEEILIKRVSREKMRSLRLIKHSSTLVDFYLNLKQYFEVGQIHFYTKTDLSNYGSLPDRRPDAYLTTKKDKKTKRYFLEIIDEGTPRFIIRFKIKQYLEYYNDSTWQKSTDHPFPEILLMCPNELIKKFLHSYIPRIIEEEGQEGIDFYLSTTPSTSWTKAVEEV